MSLTVDDVYTMIAGVVAVVAVGTLLLLGLILVDMIRNR